MNAVDLLVWPVRNPSLDMAPAVYEYIKDMAPLVSLYGSAMNSVAVSAADLPQPWKHTYAVQTSEIGTPTVNRDRPDGSAPPRGSRSDRGPRSS